MMQCLFQRVPSVTPKSSWVHMAGDSENTPERDVTSRVLLHNRW
jgi:hypothetical protein